jgi:hypothetical protein
MVARLSEKQRHALGNQHFWEGLALKLLHPTQLLIMEAFLRIEEPLSATLLQEVYEDQVGLSLLSYHCRRLEKLGVLEQVGAIPVRGVSEKLFDLADRTVAKRA